MFAAQKGTKESLRATICRTWASLDETALAAAPLGRSTILHARLIQFLCYSCESWLRYSRVVKNGSVVSILRVLTKHAEMTKKRRRIRDSTELAEV
jgi:hypothetical protein